MPKDTLEVIAYFEDEKGFFGLVSYLGYANKQINANLKYNELSNKQSGLQYEYPWRYIDDSNIEAKDFEKRQFEFTLDQTKILNLLIGHTLYNDSSVVLRELTQNAIDATKLKKYEFEKLSGSFCYEPDINIMWDEKKRELSFCDNGTGMTLDIIENHLLKVGSSRYQEENFKKKHPDFSPISRFGIGLLTCFLIADDIDIETKSIDSEKAILLKIKKVHGKYLLKYLSQERLSSEMKKHGTIIRLYLRADVKLDNIEFELKKWILIPNCNLSLDANGKKIKIGELSPGEVLTQHLNDIGYTVDGKNIKVYETTKNDVTLAIALQYIEHWKEWDFFDVREIDPSKNLPIGTCIEGVRVDFNSPGFNGRKLFALVNTSGKNAPKTNVARSNIELTPERELLLLTIYQLYLEHVSNELSNLRKSGFSITWAAKEVDWLLKPFSKSAKFSNHEIKLEDNNLFERAISKLKCILIERNENRELLSIEDLRNMNYFWSIDCASYSSADSLIKEVKSSNTSALSLLKVIFGKEDAKIDHIDSLICNRNFQGVIDTIISETFQVNAIKIIPEQRRLDLRWISTKNKKIWEEIDMQDDDYPRRTISKCLVQLEDIELETAIEQIAIKSSNALFILKNSELNKYLVRVIHQLSEKTRDNEAILSKMVSLISGLFHYKDLDANKIDEYLGNSFQRSPIREFEKKFWNKINRDELVSVLLKTDFIKYDTTIWYQREYYYY